MGIPYLPRIISSIISLIAGWGGGLLYYWIYSIFFTPNRRLTDFEAIAFWTGIFAMIAWIVFVIPLVVVFDSKHWIFSPRIAPFWGGIYGLFAFLILVGFWTGFWVEPLYLGYAVVIGALSSLVYALMGKWSQDRS
jgi:hypothetical protein